MPTLRTPGLWLLLTGVLSAAAAVCAAIAGWMTLRQQDVQIDTVKAWLTGGDSIAYYEPLRASRRLAFFIRHAGTHPAYDVVVRVHEIQNGRDRLIEGPFQVGTLSGGSGMDWTSPPSLSFFPNPPPAKSEDRGFRIEIQARNGLIVQRLKLRVVDGHWHTSSREITGGAFSRGIQLPEFKEAQEQ